MRYHIVFLAVAAATALTYPTAADEMVPFKVVVHADSPMSSLPLTEVSKFFLHKIKRWEDGSRVAPVDQDDRSEVRAAFTKAIHGRTMAAARRYWQRQIFARSDRPPPALQSDAEVIAFVAQEPCAIGYVSANAPLPASIKVLEIPDLQGHDPAAFTAVTRVASTGSRDTDRASLRDDTVNRHGDLHLFLTGSCGPGDEGRQAVLENRDPHYAVSAEIETSIWDDGWLRSSSVKRHNIQPLEEKRLGCTHSSGDVERRHAIVQASSATSHAVDRRPHRPARSVIAIVDSGSCGQGRAGTWRSVINRHTSREISASIEVRELVNKKMQRRYLKNHRLAPGATRRLGCSADGPMTRRFTVLETNYR